MLLVRNLVLSTALMALAGVALVAAGCGGGKCQKACEMQMKCLAEKAAQFGGVKANDKEDLGPACRALCSASGADAETKKMEACADAQSCEAYDKCMSAK